MLAERGGSGKKTCLSQAEARWSATCQLLGMLAPSCHLLAERPTICYCHAPAARGAAGPGIPSPYRYLRDRDRLWVGSPPHWFRSGGAGWLGSACPVEPGEAGPRLRLSRHPSWEND